MTGIFGIPKKDACIRLRLAELETLTYSFDGRKKMRDIIGRYKDGTQGTRKSEIKTDKNEETSSQIGV